ncbi:MerR family transcriptional regulator [Streptomyces sp. NPDC059373]
MRIGQAAAAAGLTPRALRYYEERGLLETRRTSAGYREYGPEDVARLRVVRELLEAGLTIADVRAIVPQLRPLPADGTVDGSPTAWPCEAAQTLWRRRLDDLDRRIDRLTRVRERLARGIGEPLRAFGGPRSGAAPDA